MDNLQTLQRSAKVISPQIGILSHVVRLPRLPGDPRIINYGIWACNTSYFKAEKFAGRSSGCGFVWENAMLGTIGETLERYAPSFYNINEAIFSTYNNLNKPAVAPEEYALFHPKQFEQPKFIMSPFTRDTEVTWFPCHDLTTNSETWAPGQLIYMPFGPDKNYLIFNTSTGLSAHTDFYKAVLGGLYEYIERDCFMLTWMNELAAPKIKITPEISSYLEKYFPKHFQWHFFDVNYDLGVPAVFGFCMGETEYGKFVAVGSACRHTYGEALLKVIQEIAQTVPYFRFLLNELNDWEPRENFSDVIDFEKHSVVYLKRPDLWHVFDNWVNAPQTREISLYETNPLGDKESVLEVVQKLADKKYNVLVKDTTTPDIRQAGFYTVKVVVPQLVQMSGTFRFYFNGSPRLYDVPPSLGYPRRTFETLNPLPHPFP